MDAAEAQLDLAYQASSQHQAAVAAGRAYQETLGRIMRRLHMSPTVPRGLAVVARELGRQAQMGAMLDVFNLITWSYLLMVPLVFLLKKSTTQRAGPVAAAADH
ncbi:MAG: hypothetical protein ABI821_20335 [Pseudomonadota bacterium]